MSRSSCQCPGQEREAQAYGLTTSQDWVFSLGAQGGVGGRVNQKPVPRSQFKEVETQESLRDGAEVRFLQGFRKLRYEATRTSESFRKLLSKTRGGCCFSPDQELKLFIKRSMSQRRDWLYSLATASITPIPQPERTLSRALGICSPLTVRFQLSQETTRKEMRAQDCQDGVCLLSRQLTSTEHKAPNGCY